jgi:hypothetical protein
MENNLGSTTGSTQHDAAALLNNLAQDRGRLAQQRGTPWLLMAGFGLLNALVIASVVLPAPRQAAPVFWVVVAIGLLAEVRRNQGVSFRKMGARGILAYVSLLILSLIGYSVALGLVAANIAWAVAIVAAIVFAITVGLASVMLSSAKEVISRG